MDVNNRQLHPDEKRLAKELAEKSKGKYTAEQIEKQMEGMSMTKGGATEGGTPAVVIGTPPEGNWVNAGTTSDGRPIYMQVLSPEDAVLRAYIVQNTTGSEVPRLITYAGPYVAPTTPNVTSNPALPPAPNGTQRVTIIVDGVAYFPLVATCPAAGCTSSGMIAAALDDALTQAYIDAEAKSQERKLNIASAGLGVGGSLLRGAKMLGDLAAKSVMAAASGAKGVGEAYNVALNPKLAEQLTMQSAKSPFTTSGTLTQDAIKGANQIIAPSELLNSNIPAGFGKYTTGTFQSPAGNFQIHFYKNPTTGEVLYGMDYKAVFNSMSGVPKKP